MLFDQVVKPQDSAEEFFVFSIKQHRICSHEDGSTSYRIPVSRAVESWIEFGKQLRLMDLVQDEEDYGEILSSLARDALEVLADLLDSLRPEQPVPAHKLSPLLCLIHMATNRKFIAN